MAPSGRELSQIATEGESDRTSICNKRILRRLLPSLLSANPPPSRREAYKRIPCIYAKMPQLMRHLWNNQIKLLAFLVFALLICDTAACLTSGLAGCLAFAATAVLSGFAKVSCFKCLDSLHYFCPQSLVLLFYSVILA